MTMTTTRRRRRTAVLPFLVALFLLGSALADSSFVYKGQRRPRRIQQQQQDQTEQQESNKGGQPRPHTLRKGSSSAKSQSQKSNQKNKKIKTDSKINLSKLRRSGPAAVTTTSTTTPGRESQKLQMAGEPRPHASSFDGSAPSPMILSAPAPSPVRYWDISPTQANNGDTETETEKDGENQAPQKAEDDPEDGGTTFVIIGDDDDEENNDTSGGTTDDDADDDDKVDDADDKVDGDDSNIGNSEGTILTIIDQDDPTGVFDCRIAPEVDANERIRVNDLDSDITHVENCADGFSSGELETHARGKWYKLVGTGEWLRVTACPGLLSIYQGDCGDLICANDAKITGSPCQAEWESIPGEIYYVLVQSSTNIVGAGDDDNDDDVVGEGNGGYNVDIQLHLEEVEAPSSDGHHDMPISADESPSRDDEPSIVEECKDNARPVAIDGEITADFTFPLKKDFSPCELGIGRRKKKDMEGAWFTVVGQGRVLRVSSCPYQLSIYTNSCDALECVQGEYSDALACEFEWRTPVSGGENYILVQSTVAGDSRSGPFKLRVDDLGPLQGSPTDSPNRPTPSPFPNVKPTTREPTNSPPGETVMPTFKPAAIPDTLSPTMPPTKAPAKVPTPIPETRSPTFRPSKAPAHSPTSSSETTSPTFAPTMPPVAGTPAPTFLPSAPPSTPPETLQPATVPSMPFDTAIPTTTVTDAPVPSEPPNGVPITDSPIFTSTAAPTDDDDDDDVLAEQCLNNGISIAAGEEITNKFVFPLSEEFSACELMISPTKRKTIRATWLSVVGDGSVLEADSCPYQLSLYSEDCEDLQCGDAMYSDARLCKFEWVTPNDGSISRLLVQSTISGFPETGDLSFTLSINAVGAPLQPAAPTISPAPSEQSPSGGSPSPSIMSPVTSPTAQRPSAASASPTIPPSFESTTAIPTEAPTNDATARIPTATPDSPSTLSPTAASKTSEPTVDPATMSPTFAPATSAPTNLVTVTPTAIETTLAPTNIATTIVPIPTDTPLVDSPTISPASISAPRNDDCPGALSLDLGETILTTTEGASTEPRGLDTCFRRDFGTNDVTRPGIWFDIAVRSSTSSNQRLRLAACDGTEATTAPVQLVLYESDNNGCDVLTCAATINHLGCSLEFDLPLSTLRQVRLTYKLLVQQNIPINTPNAGGTFSLSLEEAQVPGNDDCVRSQNVDVGAMIQGSALSATPEPPEIVTLCNRDNGDILERIADKDPVPGVWYRMFVGGRVGLLASACNSARPDLVHVTVYTGSCNNLECLSSPDFSPASCETVWDATSSESVYFILVERVLENGTDAGDFDLSIDILYR